MRGAPGSRGVKWYIPTFLLSTIEGNHPRPTLPQCRKSNTFATLKAARLESNDERGKTRIVLSRHSRKVRRMPSSPAVKFFHYWRSFFSLFPQGRGCWRGPCRQRRQGGRAAAQGWGRAVAARRPHEPARHWRAGATPSRAWRWGEQPQAWPASRQAGRQGGGCAGPRKELHFIKELRSRVSANLPRTAS